MLIADDEARIRRLVSDFKRDGHTVSRAADWPKVTLELIENRHARLAIHRRHDAGMDGECCANTEVGKRQHLPVMLLTARAGDADQVRSGGRRGRSRHRYYPIVLAARTLLKREGAASLETIGLLSVNELRRGARRDQPVDLTPKEYELLIYFKNNRSIALSREHP